MDDARLPKQAHALLAPDPTTVREVIAAMGAPPYRARQVLRWVYGERAQGFEEMTDLPQELRSRLAERLALHPLRVLKTQSSPVDDTSKFLFALPDGQRIESVFLRDGRRKIACVSTQVGCALGCRFCATGRGGLVRNLSPAEIVEQIVAIEKARERLTNVVIMGMGEPFMNADAVFEALDLMTADYGLGMSSKKITLSTSGVLPGIQRLLAGPVRTNLAWSLNSPFDKQRSELMPINARYPLADVAAACKDYAGRSGREVSIEYVLLKGVNMLSEHAEEVARIALDIGAKVNLIVYNPVEEAGFHAPTSVDVLRFRDEVKRAGAFVMIRFRRGRDIAAGCGQLRAR